jgi:rhomboid protease GluP
MTATAKHEWQPYVTYALIAANAAVFGAEVMSGAGGVMSAKITGLLSDGVNYGPETLDGQPWRLVTAMFLHFGLVHFAMNMVCLFQARIAEKIFGRRGFTVIYLIAGVLGSCASLVRTHPVASAGASGAVFGIYGALLAFLFVRRRMIDPAVWQGMTRWAGTFVGMNLVLSFQQNIDMSAHVGGLVAGGAAGAVLAFGKRPAAQELARTVGLVVAAAAITVAVLVTMRGRADAVPDHSWLGEPTAGLVDELFTILRNDHDAVARLNTTTSTGPQYADAIERDLIPPLKQFVADAAATHIPAKHAALVADMTGYAEKQIDAYEDMLVANRETDRAAANARAAQYTLDHDAAEAAVQAFADELDRLHLAE